MSHNFMPITDLPYAELYQLARALHARQPNIPAMMEATLSLTASVLGCSQGCIITFGDNDAIQHTQLLNTRDVTDDLWETLLARGLVGFVYHGQRAIIIRDVANDPRWSNIAHLSALPADGSAIGLPLLYQGDAFGVLMAVHPQVDYFNEQAVRILQEVAALTAAAIFNALQQAENNQSNIRYQTLFDDAVVPIILTDLDGNIIDINRQAVDLLGHVRHELINKPLSSIHTIDSNVIGSDGLYSLKTGEEITFRAAASTAEKVEIPVIVRARRLKLGLRNVVEWVEQDITAQMELEQLRRDLNAMVIHDLRGPLQAIHGSIQKLTSILANHENPAVYTLLQMCVRSTRQLRRLVDSLLDTQRIEEGNAILNRSEVELRVLLADAAQIVLPSILSAGQKLQFDMASNMPMVEMDNDMILRVVINLLENAHKYTPEGGTLTLAARVDMDKIYFSVEDTGPGIPNDLQLQIFDKFNRVKYQNAPVGIGLGLAFCRLAVEAHGGQIWVESDAKNGSKFIFTLPLISAPKDDLFAEFINTLEE
jgi:PAS domain S-box-containing protein